MAAEARVTPIDLDFKGKACDGEILERTIIFINERGRKKKLRIARFSKIPGILAWNDDESPIDIPKFGKVMATVALFAKHEGLIPEGQASFTASLAAAVHALDYNNAVWCDDTIMRTYSKVVEMQQSQELPNNEEFKFLIPYTIVYD